MRSQKIIVPTYDVYNDITRAYPDINKNKFVVSYEGVDPIFNTGQREIQDSVLKEFDVSKGNYLLYISSMYEHKNVERLLDAFALLINKYGYKGKLVLIGKKDKFSQRIAEIVIEKNLENKVIMPGTKRYITDMELISFRKNAELYVFPSLKEGFSLTPLEAQTAGLACVISNISCHKEVFEDTVVYFDPKNTADIAEKILAVIKNPELKQTLIQKGFANLKKFDWINTAKTTLQIFNDVLSKKK